MRQCACACAVSHNILMLAHGGISLYTKQKKDPVPLFPPGFTVRDPFQPYRQASGFHISKKKRDRERMGEMFDLCLKSEM